MSDQKNKFLQKIDSQCLAYEQSCRQGNLDCIRDFLAEAPEESRLTLTLELAKIFVFYCCKDGHVAAGTSIGMLKKQLPSFDDPSQLTDLLRTEFQCRIECDMSANIDEYDSILPDVPQLRSKLTEELLCRYPVRIRLINEDFTVFSTNLSERIVAGRQDRDEVDPPAIVSVDELESRLILAARVDTKVARKHARIEPFSADRVKVTALSKRSATFINEDRLAAGSPMISPIPLELRLGPQRLRLEPIASGMRPK